MGEKIEIEGYDEVLREMEHEELVGAVKSVVAAISNIKKDDPELKNLLYQNSQVIYSFVEVIKGLGKPAVSVETNQDKVVEAIGRLAVIMKGIDDRLTALEDKNSKPLPTKLLAQRGHNGQIDYVIIEYKS